MSPYQGICCCSCNHTELFDTYGTLNFFPEFHKKKKKPFKNILFILLSFLSAYFDFEWLQLPVWLHVAGRGHTFFILL